MTITTAIFDFGNVINRWEPHKAVASLYPDQDAAESAFEIYQFKQWVGSIMDSGEDVDASLKQIAQADPGRHRLLVCYVNNIALAHATPVDGTEPIINGLLDRGVSVLGMTNCGLLAFEALEKNFAITSKMKDVFVSAKEKVCKPDPYAYYKLLTRNGLSGSECLFVDDSKANVEAAKFLGMHGHLFKSAAHLEIELATRGLLQREAS